MIETFAKKSFHELSEEQELKLEKNIAWIFGANRSGTSWLARQIVESGYLKMDEPLLGEHLGISIRQENKMIRQFDIRRKNESYFFSEKYKEVWIFFLRKLFLNRVYALFQTVEKKIVIKEPNGSIGADIISECFPKSKFIILLRDPRDILDSRVDALSETGWSAKRGWKPITSKNKIPFIERESFRWNQLIKILMETYNNKKENCLLIKYEELRGNTFVELTKIFKFLELKIDDNELQRIIDRLSFEKIPASEKGSGKRKRSASPGKWRENFSDKEKEIMNKILAKGIQEVGYEL